MYRIKLSTFSYISIVVSARIGRFSQNGSHLPEASVAGTCTLGIEREAKTLLPNSATSMHIVMSNSVGKDIEEGRPHFAQVHVTVVLAGLSL